MYHNKISIERTPRDNSLGLVVLCHHFGGSRRTLLRHRRFYLDAGYDVLSRDFAPFNFWPFAHERQNLRDQWIAEFRELLDHQAAFRPLTPSDRYFVHALSSFSSVALSSLSRFPHSRVQAVICENGPFLESSPSFDRLLEHHYKIHNRWIKKFLLVSYGVKWDPKYDQRMIDDLENLRARQNLQLQSLQFLFVASQNDTLIPREDIRKCISTLPGAQELYLENATHLSGLRTHRKEFQTAILNFLENI